MPSDTYILTISDAGVSVPSSHASTHITGGSDVIPTATSSTSGLMSAAIFNQHVTNTAKVENKIHTGDVTDAAGVLTVNKINGVLMESLATGIVKNTTGTGAPSIAIAADFPPLNQNTTGNAATATRATNLASGSAGSVPYQTAANTTAMLSAGTAGQFLKSNGAAAPVWGAVNMSTDLTGTLPVDKGGTGAAILSGILKGNGTNAFTAVPQPAGDLVGTTATQTLTNKTLGSGTTVTDLGTPNSGTLTNCTGLPIIDGTTGTLSVVRGGTGVTSSTGSGANVLATSPVLVTPQLGTPTSGTLTSCTGLPISGLVSSTSTALGVGSIELGHATDTTISRASAGRIAVEGVIVVTASSTDTLTNKTLVAPVLGTPTSGTLTNCTGLPIDGGTTGTLPVDKGGTGVTQSAYAESYISSSAATTYSATNTWYKISGYTSLTTGENFDDASGTSNRIRYTGTANRAFFITVCGTVTGANSNTILVGLYVSGTHMDASITAVTTSGTPKHQFSSQAIVFLDTNDYIEVHTQNQSSTSSATFERLSICAHALV
jgi:hypothetical protein